MDGMPLHPGPHVLSWAHLNHRTEFLSLFFRSGSLPHASPTKYASWREHSERVTLSHATVHGQCREGSPDWYSYVYGVGHSPCHQHPPATAILPAQSLRLDIDEGNMDQMSLHGVKAA